MEKRQITSQTYLRELNILYWALVTGSLILIVLAYMLVSPIDPSFAGDLYHVILIFFPILAFASLILSLFLFRNKMKQLIPEKNLGKKLREYRSALLIRWTIIEGACYFSIIGFGLLRVNLLLALVAFLLAYFIFLKPAPLRIVTDLELNDKDRKKLEDPEQVLYEADE